MADHLDCSVYEVATVAYDWRKNEWLEFNTWLLLEEMNRPVITYGYP